MVPHLVTALTGPINELEQRVLDSTPAEKAVGWHLQAPVASQSFVGIPVLPAARPSASPV